MHIRTFRAPNLQSALSEIREQMGAEAAVLHTRHVRGGLFGWTGRKQIEVTAGLRDSPPQKNTAAVRIPQNELHASVQQLLPLVKELKERSHRGGDVESPICRMLQGMGLDRDTVEQLIRLAEQTRTSPLPLDPEEAWPFVMKGAATLIRTGSPIRASRGRRRIVALAGPTGVGKTTTLAKLAAGFRLQTGLHVGLITIDTFRTGAVEQLRTYGQIMGLPMEVVADVDELSTSLERLQECNLVLMDTAGRSPRDQPHVQQLADMFRVAQPDEVHLVVSATTSAYAAERVIRGYASIEPTGLILSKLDEVDHAASLLPVISRAAPPLTYLTNGQNVPDDIQRAAVPLILQGLFGNPFATDIV